AQGFLTAPFSDLLMMSRKKRLRDRQTFKFRRTGVVRIFQKAVAKRIQFSRFTTAKSSGNQSRYRVDNRHCGNFTTRKNKISKRNVVFSVDGSDSLVDPLVTAANNDQPGPFRKLTGNVMGEKSSVGRCQHNR